MREQTEALEREEDALEAERQRTSQEEVKAEESRRRSGATSVGLFGSRGGFGSASGGSMFKPKG